MPRVFRSRLSARQLAFTLVEVVVGMSIVLILAAVALPALGGYLDQKTVESAADQLQTVRDALYGTADSYEKVVGALPARLSHLTTAVVDKNASFLNSCDAQYTKAAANWTGGGPFVNFPINATTGMATPIGAAADTLTRNPTTATAGTLRINFVNAVERRYAVALNDYIESTTDSATGIVQWVTGTDGRVTMYYYISINNTC